MFETSVIQVHAQAAAGRLRLLTFSVIAHSAVILGAAAFSLASADFPMTAPDAYEEAPMLLPVAVPPPLGNSESGQQVRPQPPKEAPAPPKPGAVTAPREIPDAVMPADVPAGPVSEATGPATGETQTPGVQWGVPDSPGNPAATPVVGSTPPVEEKIYQPYEVKAPVLLHRVDPVYPQLFVRAGVAQTVVVRCVIDRNGHVRSPEIVSSGMKPFDDAVVAALRQWRYTPASLRGVAVDSYLDVTVRFSVRR